MEEAIECGIENGGGHAPSQWYSVNKGLQEVLLVIKKYNAIPQELKEEENGVPTT